MLRLTRSDALLVGGLALTALLLWLAFGTGLSQAQADVIIMVEGRLCGVYPLDLDQVITLDGSRGPAVVEIAAGRVRIASSDCPDCRWHAHWLSGRGSLVCVPNRVLVEVRAGSAGEPDAVTR